jgi:Fe-S cluster assembly protein SufD
MTQNLERIQERFEPGLRRAETVRLSELKQEPAWLRERRLEAWDLYEQTPVPTPSQRDWKYTDITRLNFDQFSAFAAPPPDESRRASLDLLAGSPEARRGLLIQHDSLAIRQDLDESLRQSGLIFCSLDEAVHLYPDLVREHLMTGVPAASDKLTALHAALWSGGAFIYVPRDLEVGLPLHSLVWADRSGLAVFPHVLVIAEAGSRLTLIDEYESPKRDGFSLSSAVSEFFIRDGAEVRYVNLQGWDTGTYHFSTQRAILGRDAALRYVTAGLGSRLSKLRSEAILEGNGSNSEMLGLFFGERGQKFDAISLQDHRGAHTKSDLLYKAALRDRAQSVYYGLVRVGPEARGSDANQENRNLLLSEQAKADSDPVLEILTSEVVRCGHGATVGPVDEEQLFYLQCRGMQREQAERLLVEAFFTSVIQRVPVVQIRSTLERAVRERLAA